jgi:hypothetical protein
MIISLASEDNEAGRYAAGQRSNFSLVKGSPILRFINGNIQEHLYEYSGFLKDFW